MDYEKLGKKLDKAVAEDPYGTTIAVFREAVTRALKNEGMMNSKERDILITTCQFINAQDHYADLPEIDLGPIEERDI